MVMKRKNTYQRKIFISTFRQFALFLVCLTSFTSLKAEAQAYETDWKILNPQNSPTERFGHSITEFRIYDENGVIIFDG